MGRQREPLLIAIGGDLSFWDATNVGRLAPIKKAEQSNSRLLLAEKPETANAIMELKRLSGLTWESLARLFAVSRRSLHFWASGRPQSAENEERLQRLLAALRQIDRGDAASNRKVLCSALADGQLPLDLLAQGQYETVIRQLGRGARASHPALQPLSRQAAAARTPPPPAELVGALQDSVHREVGRSRPARSVRVKKKP